MLTGQTGELRFANVSGPDAPPTVQPIEAGAYTSAPTSLVTGDGLRRHGWQPRLAGWLVEARAPLTGPQVARARQVAADAGMTVEARDHQTRLAATRSGATAAGLLLALGILARTVGLIRGEAAGDLRTLTATGATGGCSPCSAPPALPGPAGRLPRRAGRPRPGPGRAPRRHRRRPPGDRCRGGLAAGRPRTVHPGLAATGMMSRAAAGG